MHSTRLDGVAGLGAAVGPVHHAHEVGRRRHKPELDGPVVEGVHPDPVGVGVVAQVVVLPVLQDEIDRHGRARAPRIQYPLDAELDVVRGERHAVGPSESLPQVEDVPEAVVGDLPSVGE